MHPYDVDIILMYSFLTWHNLSSLMPAGPPTILEQSIQRLRAFSNRSLQSLQVQPQSLQNSWGNLFGVNLVSDDSLAQIGIAGKTCNVSVVIAQTAVLGHLGIARRVDYSKRRSDKDMWYSRRCGRVAEALCNQLLAVDDFLN